MKYDYSPYRLAGLFFVFFATIIGKDLEKYISRQTIFGKPKGFAFESIRGFVDGILEGTEFPVTMKDAANTSLAILAIMESAKTRTPVEVQY